MSPAADDPRGRRVRGVVDLSPRSLALAFDGEPRLYLWIHFRRDEAVYAAAPVLPVPPDPRGSRYAALEAPMRGARVAAADETPGRYVLELRSRSAGARALRLSLTAPGPRANLELTAEPDARVLWAYHRGPAGEATTETGDQRPAAEGTASGGSGDAAAGRTARVRRAADEAAVAALRTEIRAVFQADFDGAVRRTLKRAEHRLTRRTEAAAEDLERARALQEDRRRGEALLAHYQEVQRGASRVGLPDPYADSPGARIEIELDPSLTPHKNAARLFQRAKKGERGERLAAERLARTRKSLAGLAEVRRELLSRAPKEALERVLAFLAEAQLQSCARGDLQPAVPEGKANGAPRAGRPGRRGPGGPEARKPRTFTTSDGWEVWVGRNNTENDLITHRRSNPHDFWFHVVGVPGSHVILRRPTRSAVPKPRTLIEAAEIAAYFSKARKRPRVPVIYTERKFVSKPRRGKPGQAICTRERELDVRPRLPKAHAGGNGEDREVSS